jgi:EmrB/QacA subfamily drug resistance transporter
MRNPGGHTAVDAQLDSGGGAGPTGSGTDPDRGANATSNPDLSPVLSPVLSPDSNTASGPLPPDRLDPRILKLGAALVVGSIAAMLDMTMVTVALADLARSSHAPVSTVQWISAAYLLAIATVIPVTGRLAERFGARRMWIFALVAFLIGSALCASAWSAASLIAFRVVQGIGGGMIVPLGTMMLARAAGPGRRGRVMGLVAVPTQLAPVAGPLIGGLITYGAGWRWIFVVNVPICLIAVVLAKRFLPPDSRSTDAIADAAAHAEPADARRPDRRRRPDVIGLALLSPGLALTVYGLSERTAWLPLLVTGSALLAAFVVHALRSGGTTPLLDLRLLAHRPLAAASALSFLSRLSVFGVMILMPLYYQQFRGHDALSAGLLLAPQSLGTMLALPRVGRLTDRIGARPVVLAGIAVTVLGSVVFTRVGATSGGVALGAALFVWGIGVAAVTVPVSAAAYDGLPPAAIPDATSTLMTIQTVGASAGAAVLAAILQNRLARHAGDPAAAFAETFRWVLLFTLLTAIPALLLPFRRRAAGGLTRSAG